MSFYIGFYKSGKVKVFQTSKAVTKKSFPFYAKVMGPFDDEEEAREEAEKHAGRLGMGLSYSRERQIRRRLERNPGSNWSIYYRTPSQSRATDKALGYREEGKDAKVVFNSNSGGWEVWCRAVERNPAKLDRFRPFHGGTSTFCKCGHLEEVHVPNRTRLSRNYCKLCSCRVFVPERTRSRENPPGHKIYDNILAIEARKGKDSLWPKESFRHDFKGGATVEGMPDGSLRVKSKNGKRLWRNFNYD